MVANQKYIQAMSRDSRACWFALALFATLALSVCSAALAYADEVGGDGLGGVAAGEQTSSAEAPASPNASDAALLGTQDDRTVYVSRSNIYHYLPNCSGMKRYTAMTLSAALAKGAKPCEKCAHDSGGSGSGSGSGGSGSGGSGSGSGSGSGGSSGQVTPTPTPVIPPAPSEDASGVWKRLWGANAYGTMVQAVSEGWKSSDTVVVATFDGYWDALAASALAGSEKTPVLLTSKDRLSPETAQLIKSLGAKKAYICGGTGAVSAAVEKSIKGMGLSVERFGGQTAFNTAELISAKAKANLGGACDTCVVATIDGFYDSLSVAPGAYALGMPVYLTNGDKVLAPSTVSAIKAAGYEKAVIVGGEAAVKPAVVGQLTSAGVKSVERLGGANAWRTSELIAEWGLKHGLTAQTVGVADGNGYWDALTGAPLIGLRGGSLVLVPHDGPTFDGVWTFAYDPYCIEHFVKSNGGSVEQGYVFGGEGAVSKRAYDACVAATNGAAKKLSVQADSWLRAA